MRNFLRSQLDRYFGVFARKSDLDNLYAQLAALLDVRDIVGHDVILGPLRGWALSPDALAIILHDIRGRDAPRVIEFGAGKSTLAIAAVLRVKGKGSLVTFEHDPDHRDKVARRLAAAELDRWVDLRVADMREYPARSGFETFMSYDLSALNSIYDVALVDGPITSVFGHATRLVPLNGAPVTSMKRERSISMMLTVPKSKPRLK